MQNSILIWKIVNVKCSKLTFFFSSMRLHLDWWEKINTEIRFVSVWWLLIVHSSSREVHCTNAIQPSFTLWGLMQNCSGIIPKTTGQAQFATAAVHLTTHAPFWSSMSIPSANNSLHPRNFKPHKYFSRKKIMPEIFGRQLDFQKYVERAAAEFAKNEILATISNCIQIQDLLK